MGLLFSTHCCELGSLVVYCYSVNIYIERERKRTRKRKREKKRERKKEKEKERERGSFFVHIPYKYASILAVLNIAF